MLFHFILTVAGCGAALYVMVMLWIISERLDQIRDRLDQRPNSN
jgi:hypothetical protein